MFVIVRIPTDCSSKAHAFAVVQRVLEFALCHAPGAMHIEGTPDILGTEDDIVNGVADHA